MFNYEKQGILDNDYFNNFYNDSLNKYEKKLIYIYRERDSGYGASQNTKSPLLRIRISNL
jgi:hypothetical protein